MFPSRRSAVVIPVIAVALMLGACSGKPENSPVIRKKFAEMDELKQQVEETNKSVRSVAADITIIRDELTNLRAMAPDAAGGSELVRRIEQLEQRLGVMNDARTVANNVQPTSNAADPIGNALAAAAKPAGDSLAVPTTPKQTATSVKPKVEFSGLKAAPKTTEVKSTSTKTTTTSAPAKTSTPRGRYYTIQANDTLDKIAAENKISVSELRAANSLPSGARPLKGQRLFIPTK